MKLSTTAFLTCSLLTIAAGCDPNGASPDVSDVPPGTETETEALFTKSVRAHDLTGENTASITIRSDDADLLEGYTDETFELIPTRSAEDALAPDVLGGDVPMDLGSEELDSGSFIELEVAQSSLADGVLGFRLEERQAPLFRDPFAWVYFYSALDCVDVSRHALFNTVYVSVWYRAVAGGAWNSIANSVKINNNTTFSRCQVGSNQLKVGVNRRNSNDFSIQFWE